MEPLFITNKKCNEEDLIFDFDIIYVKIRNQTKRDRIKSTRSKRNRRRFYTSGLGRSLGNYGHGANSTGHRARK